MAMQQPLLPGGGRHTKASLLYGADQYLEHLAKKYEDFPELSVMLQGAPDADFAHDSEASKAAASKAPAAAQGMLAQDVDADKRSKVTKRAIPTPNIPDPMPPELAFMYAKITPEQQMYMWNVYTLIFLAQCLSVVAYWGMLTLGLGFYTSTAVFGVAMTYLTIQNVYILHDVIHGATFPPYEWQTYITHPFADFISLPWMDVIMEHNRHHNSTFDLLNHGEFGWDPAMWLYVLQEWTDKWYGWLTVPLVPVWHFVGASDTGGLFAILWWLNFPDAGPGGKCDKSFFTKWGPARVKHLLFLFCLWGSVWLLGSWGLGRPLAEGWRFTLVVSCFGRLGFTAAWTLFTNMNHSHWWNEFLATDPERAWPWLHAAMAFIVGGKHRWNEFLFHDVHHMCPGRIGAMSQRGRFHGWDKVHDACVEILSRGLWKSDDPETLMDQHERKRSMLVKSRQAEKGASRFVYSVA